jgi:mRNA interferase RelE/StbE
MYDLFIDKNAEKGLKVLLRNITGKINKKILELKENPRPVGCRKILGTENNYRIRMGDYRAVYEIDEAKKRVIVLAAGHGKDIYRNL